MTYAPSHSVRFFHGTSRENAELLIDIDLTPRLAFELFSPRIQRRLD